MYLAGLYFFLSLSTQCKNECRIFDINSVRAYTCVLSLSYKKRYAIWHLNTGIGILFSSKSDSSSGSSFYWDNFLPCLSNRLSTSWYLTWVDIWSYVFTVLQKCLNHAVGIYDYVVLAKINSQFFALNLVSFTVEKPKTIMITFRLWKKTPKFGVLVQTTLRVVGLTCVIIITSAMWFCTWTRRQHECFASHRKKNTILRIALSHHVT